MTAFLDEVRLADEIWDKIRKGEKTCLLLPRAGQWVFLKINDQLVLKAKSGSRMKVKIVDMSNQDSKLKFDIEILECPM